MKKIIYLANVRIPTEKAHGLQIMKMCQTFVRQGFELELVVAKRINPQFKKTNPFDYYDIKERFKIKKLPVIDMVAIGRSLKGFSVLIQNTSFALSTLFYLLFKRADIIFSRDEFSLFFLSFFKKNLVLELHTFPQSKFSLYRTLLKKVKKIIVITKSLEKLLVEQLGVNENKIIVAPDGVDLEQFEVKETKDQCRQKLNLPQDKNIILYTGHLFNWKGVYTLAEASKYLSDKELIVMVGGMEYDIKKLQDFIKENNLKNILLIKHQPPTKIPYYLKAADVLVLPNSKKKKISQLYTSPMKMFEYMASQQPIVASDLPSIREVLNENNAILIPPDDPQALAEGIKRALKNPDFSAKLLKQAYQDVIKYSWDKRAENIIKYIKNL